VSVDGTSVNPAAASGIRYRLVEAAQPFNSEGSTFGEQVTRTSPPSVWTMGGSFVATPVEPLPAETRLMFRISQVNFSAGPFVLEAQGDAGFVSISALDSAEPLTITLKVTLHYTHAADTEVEFTGAGAADTFTMDTPPAFELLGLRFVPPASETSYHGPQYGLRLYAVPEG
jgi:hypothetical protein